MGNFALLPGATVGEPIKADWAWKIRDGINQLRPKRRDGQRITTTPYGTKLEYDAEASREVDLTAAVPFQVRWYQQNLENPDVGEWQVYLPYGCVTVNGRSCVPANDDGTDEGGEAIWQWYKIPDPQEKDARPGTFSGFVVKEWTVYLHVKPWTCVKVSTEEDDEEFGMVMERVAIATIGVIEMEDYSDRVTVDVYKDAGIEFERDEGGAFAIRYESKDDRRSQLKVILTNQSIKIGRRSFHLEEKDITGWKEVWVKITHDSEECSVSVEKDLSDEETNDDQTVFRIYRMEDNVVVEDERKDMPILDFYTNGPDTGN